MNRNLFSRRSFLQTGTAFVAAAGMPIVTGRAETPMPAKSAERLRIAHMCDPQFGFSSPSEPEKSYVKDLAIFEKAIAKVNELKPDIALIAGDMTHIAADITRDWPRLLKLFTVPVAVAPGNHDLGNTIVHENLERYLSVFGYDYKRFEVKGWRLLVGNSQYWQTVKDKEIVERKERYGAWVKDELTAAASSCGGHVILASHIPPFVSSVGEKGSYENHPQNGRKERIKSYLEAGVRFYLCGHLHKTLMRGWQNLTLLNAEVTSRSFDERPLGFRLFEVSPDFTYSWNFISC
ncbi:MAG: metallophosphoesterase [Kiritimatiellae bacterium]|nr:metallophosphoesterase [Kiritimatiellia bacterium]